MTDFEYGTLLAKIVQEDRAFDAVRDLLDTIQRKDRLLLSVISELKSERQTVKKICSGNDSNKSKVEAISNLIGE